MKGHTGPTQPRRPTKPISGWTKSPFYCIDIGHYIQMNSYKANTLSKKCTFAISRFHCICSNKWLTHWGRDKVAAIFQTPFSNAFSWMEMYEFRLKFHWSLFPMVQLRIFQHWFPIMAWRRPGDKPLFGPMMVRLLTHICVAPPRWAKTICGLVTPYDYRTGSTFSKIMACCLTASSH